MKSIKTIQNGSVGVLHFRKFSSNKNYITGHKKLREPPIILRKYKRIVTPSNIFIVLMNRRFD